MTKPKNTTYTTGNNNLVCKFYFEKLITFLVDYAPSTKTNDYLFLNYGNNPKYNDIGGFKILHKSAKSQLVSEIVIMNAGNFTRLHARY